MARVSKIETKYLSISCHLHVEFNPDTFRWYDRTCKDHWHSQKIVFADFVFGSLCVLSVHRFHLFIFVVGDNFYLKSDRMACQRHRDSVQTFSYNEMSCWLDCFFFVITRTVCGKRSTVLWHCREDFLQCPAKPDTSIILNWIDGKVLKNVRSMQVQTLLGVHSSAEQKSLVKCNLCFIKWCCSNEKIVLHQKYFRYLHQTNTIVFTMISAINRANC